MEENVIQTRKGATINISLSVKIQNYIVCVRKIMFGILLHVVAKLVNI